MTTPGNTIKSSPAAADEALQMLRDLEQNTSDEIRRQRAHDRLVVKCKLIVAPGNSSQRQSFVAQGVTGDISGGGCNALLPVPLLVGDIYLLTLDRAQVDIPPVFARCQRCRFVREDAFEVGFAFLQPVKLPATAGASAPTNRSGAGKEKASGAMLV